MAYGPPVTTTATTLSALTPPGTPSGLTATPGSNRVRLNWTAASGATGYVVEYRQGTGQWQPGYSGPNTQATITGLTPDTEYDFRLKATNDAGESGWVTVIVNTKEMITQKTIVYFETIECFNAEVNNKMEVG